MLACRLDPESAVISDSFAISSLYLDILALEFMTMMEFTGGLIWFYISKSYGGKGFREGSSPLSTQSCWI